MSNPRTTGEDPTEAKWIPMKSADGKVKPDAVVRNPHSPANKSYFDRNPKVRERLIKQGY